MIALSQRWQKVDRQQKKTGKSQGKTFVVVPKDIRTKLLKELIKTVIHARLFTAFR